MKSKVCGKIILSVERPLHPSLDILYLKDKTKIISIEHNFQSKLKYRGFKLVKMVCSSISVAAQ